MKFAFGILISLLRSPCFLLKRIGPDPHLKIRNISFPTIIRPRYYIFRYILIPIFFVFRIKMVEFLFGLIIGTELQFVTTYLLLPQRIYFCFNFHLSLFFVIQNANYLGPVFLFFIPDFLFVMVKFI